MNPTTTDMITTQPGPRPAPRSARRFGTGLLALALACSLAPMSAMAPGRMVAPAAKAVQPAPTSTTFQAIDIFVDAGERPLSAYQVEVLGPPALSLVGVEGGAAGSAFAPTPYYDPAALKNSRIILAGIAQGVRQAEVAPGLAAGEPGAPQGQAGRVRVARLHVAWTGQAQPLDTLRSRVVASVDAAAAPVPATLSLEIGDSK
jgi:hypothetical protein